MVVDFPPDSVIIVLDASQHASADRLTVFRMEGNTPVVVTRTKAAVGRGSDPDGDGWLNSFSNAHNSLATSEGRYRIAEQYVGKYGISYRLDGLDSSNSNARSRAVVIHEAAYVTPERAGRSYGCIAVMQGWIKRTLTPLLTQYPNAFLIVKGNDE